MNNKKLLSIQKLTVKIFFFLFVEIDTSVTTKFAFSKKNRLSSLKFVNILNYYFSIEQFF